MKVPRCHHSHASEGAAQTEQFWELPEAAPLTAAGWSLWQLPAGTSSKSIPLLVLRGPGPVTQGDPLGSGGLNITPACSCPRRRSVHSSSISSSAPKCCLWDVHFAGCPSEGGFVKHPALQQPSGLGILCGSGRMVDFPWHSRELGKKLGTHEAGVGLVWGCCCRAQALALGISLEITGSALHI